MKREDITVGMKVIPHSKTTTNYGGLNWSTNWKRAKEINQPYLFVSGIQTDKIILSNENRKDNVGDYFLPEDLEPYIESNTNQENDNESGNIKMKKSDLNSSMLFKMRNGNLCVLLETINDKMFYKRQEIIDGSYSGQISLEDYDDNISIIGDQYESDFEYEIVAIKQCQSCTESLRLVVISTEPEEWDWVEEVGEKLTSDAPIINNFTINVTVDSLDEDYPQKIMKQINDVLKKNGLRQNA